MGDEEAATLEGQFVEFSKMLDFKKERDGTLITLYRSDFWLRQAKILDDRKVTMTDTGLMWWKYAKTELNWDEWYGILQDLIVLKHLDQEYVELALTNCGLPGATPVIVPEYKTFFENFKPKSKMAIE